MIDTPRSTILVVDDEPFNRDLLVQQLDTYETCLATNGAEALALVAATPPDLVLLDIMMPGMDGFEVCRRLKADDRTRLIPIVIMTALDGTEERIRGIEAGADDFLTKPVDERQLLARIRTALRAKHYVDQKLDSVLAARPPQALGSVRACSKCYVTYSAEAATCALCGSPVTYFDKDPLVGQRLDRYEIKERWGSGGMGCVYVASHATLKDQRYAIKVLHGEFCGRPEYVERFAREADACARLEHPNIVGMLDFASTPDGLKYMVMEFAQGRTLREIIESEAPLSFRRAASIARQVASALACAHERGIVHRDVKPSNVMVRESELGERVKLLDFGIVLSLASGASARLTTTGVVVGTPLYMAPEQIRDGEVGPPADLYALGVTLYEMISGRAPFDGSALKVAADKLGMTPEPPSTNTGLDRLTWSLMAPRPEHRPASAEAVIAALDTLAVDRNEPIVESLSVLDDDAAAPAAQEGLDPPPHATTRSPAASVGPVAATLASPSARPDQSRGPSVRLALLAIALAVGVVAAWALR